MEGLNQVILVGNIGEAPKLRSTKAGVDVLSLRMATAIGFWDETANEHKERVEWHSVVVWGKRGKALAGILSKGSRIIIRGELRTRKWKDDQGQERYTTEVHALDVVLGGGKKRDHEESDGGT